MTKAAILIDGDLFLKHLPTVCREVDRQNPDGVARVIDRLRSGFPAPRRKREEAAHVQE